MQNAMHPDKRFAVAHRPEGDTHTVGGPSVLDTGFHGAYHSTTHVC